MCIVARRHAKSHVVCCLQAALEKKGSIDRIFGPMELWASSWSGKTITDKTLDMNKAIDQLREVCPEHARPRTVLARACTSLHYAGARMQVMESASCRASPYHRAPSLFRGGALMMACQKPTLAWRAARRSLTDFRNQRHYAQR